MGAGASVPSNQAADRRPPPVAMKVVGADASYGFLVDWDDKQAGLTRRYKMTYYVRNGNPAGNEVDLFDMKNKRTFLKRTPYKSIGVDHLFLGSKVTVFSRPMTITDFADPITKAKFAQQNGFLLLLAVEGGWGSTLARIETEFKISKLKMVQFSAGEVSKVCDQLPDQLQQQFSNVCRPNTPILAMTLNGADGVSGWERLSRGGMSGRSFTHTSQKAIDLVFGERAVGNTTAALQSCTCCVIKPHAVLAKLAGSLVADVQGAGFHVSAIQMFELERDVTEEFLEVYKGVAPGYKSMVTELSSGPCVALCINGPDGVVQAFRKLCGPFQFDFAKQLRPDTLRARYGSTDTQNAIHCTDLPDDGEEECEYLFSVQQ